MYLFSLYYISKDKYSKYYLNQVRIRAMVSLYLMYVAKDNKTKCVLIPFFVINLKRLLWIYSSMCDEPWAFIWESPSDWSDLGMINC